MNEDAKFALTAGERSHPLWLKLKSHFEARLAVLRQQNDGPLDPNATSELRGRIKLLKEMIALGEEPPLIDG